ncbi:MAG: SMC-Scp complex subunit ScpB [Clostridia bacterium]|nr:SMC-Scp complex subunit ScpB [Clostridia bacterium]MDD3232160.1 SMC-Scp complex subunit ScpB [Clostridia bacterium]
MKNLKEIIKATLFVAGEGIEIEDFSEKFDVSVNEIKKAIEELKAESDDFSGIQIIQYKNKIQLASNSKYADYISAVLNPIREKALTKAMLETLSIIAYKQPITRMEIEDIRRVSCDYALNILEEHKMIEVVGRKDAVGKPLLYGTTEDFLKRFGLLNLEQLPKLQELLERIAVIREEERKSDNLYNDFKLQDLSAENSKNKADDVNEFTEPYEQDSLDALQELQSKLSQSGEEKQKAQ